MTRFLTQKNHRLGSEAALAIGKVAQGAQEINAPEVRP